MSTLYRVKNKHYLQLLTLYAQITHNIMWIRVGYIYEKPHDMMNAVQEIIVKVVMCMTLMTDDLLVDSYNQAVMLHLDEEFIALLLAEMQRRRLRPVLTQHDQ